jgi:hypothetical protein
MYTSPTGCAPPALRPVLHPWLQPAAPLGPKHDRRPASLRLPASPRLRRTSRRGRRRAPAFPFGVPQARLNCGRSVSAQSPVGALASSPGRQPAAGWPALGGRRSRTSSFFFSPEPRKGRLNLNRPDGAQSKKGNGGGLSLSTGLPAQGGQAARGYITVRPYGAEAGSPGCAPAYMASSA